MLGSLKNLLLVLACSLLMLHNFTPHTHHPGSDEEVMLIRNSIPERSGLLQKLFQMDLGCNHLEEASQSKFNYHLASVADQLTYSSETVIPAFVITKCIASKGFENLNTFKLRQACSTCQSLRAPPVMA